MTKYALRAMLAEEADTAGRAIVNTSFQSTAATPGMSAYPASNAGLDAMIRAIALEVGPSAIPRSEPACSSAERRKAGLENAKGC
jgi:NAD(P)-dependent dehydrogenase (short-subunit alcohol dehydrogenase family)